MRARRRHRWPWPLTAPPDAASRTENFTMPKKRWERRSA